MRLLLIERSEAKVQDVIATILIVPVLIGLIAVIIWAILTIAEALRR